MAFSLDLLKSTPLSATTFEIWVDDEFEGLGWKPQPCSFSFFLFLVLLHVFFSYALRLINLFFIQIVSTKPIFFFTHSFTLVIFTEFLIFDFSSLKINEGDKAE